MDFLTAEERVYVFQFCCPVTEERDQFNYSTVDRKPDHLTRCESSEIFSLNWSFEYSDIDLLCFRQPKILPLLLALNE